MRLETITIVDPVSTKNMKQNVQVQSATWDWQPPDCKQYWIKKVPNGNQDPQNTQSPEILEFVPQWSSRHET